MLGSKNLIQVQTIGSHIFKKVKANLDTLYYVDKNEKNNDYCLFSLTEKVQVDPKTRKKIKSYTSQLKIALSPDYYKAIDMANQWSSNDTQSRYVFFKPPTKQDKKTNSEKNTSKIQKAVFTSGKYKGKNVAEINDIPYLVWFYLNQYNNEKNEYNSSSINALIVKNYLEESGLLEMWVRQVDNYQLNKTQDCINYLSEAVKSDQILTGKYQGLLVSDLLNTTDPDELAVIKNYLSWFASRDLQKLYELPSKVIDDCEYKIVTLNPLKAQSQATAYQATRYMLIQRYASKLGVPSFNFKFECDLKLIQEQSLRSKISVFDSKKLYNSKDHKKCCNLINNPSSTNPDDLGVVSAITRNYKTDSETTQQEPKQKAENIKKIGYTE